MERLGDEVELALRRSGSLEALPLTRLVAAWPTAVGDTIARNAWPRRIARDGTLHVATSSATWASELALLADELLDRLREHLGAETPSALRCAVGPVPEPPAEPPLSGADTPLSEASPEVAATAAAVASAIDDPELRGLVARAARSSLSRRASDRHF